ncbi:MAG: diguanylate cyclase [Oscillospiraceae bacterium]
MDDDRNVAQQLRCYARCPIIKCGISVQSKVLWANDCACKFIGVPSGGLDGLPLANIVNDHDWRTLIRSLEICGFDSGGYCEIMRVHTAEGKERIVRIKGSKFEENGESLAILTLEEVSRQTEYYEELQKDNDELHRLVANVPCGFFSYDIDAGNLFCGIGSGMLELLGYTEGEFRRIFANSYFRMIFEEDREQARSTVFAQIANTSRSELSYRVRSKSGELRWLYEKGHLVVDTCGKRIFYVAVLDVTEWYRTQDDFRTATLELDTIAENMPGGLGIFEIDGEVKLKFGNDRYFELFGWNKNNGNLMPSILKQIDAKDVSDFIDKAKETAVDQRTFRMEFKINRRDGTIIWCECISKVLKLAETGVHTVLSIMTDVTDRKKFERELAVQAERYRIIEKITDEVLFEYDPQTDIMQLPRTADTVAGNPVEIRSFRVLMNRREGGGNGKDSLAKALDVMMENSQNKIVDFFTDYFTGDRQWYRAAYVNIKDAEGVSIRIIGRLRNITREREEKEKLIELACIDPMTELLNRSTLSANVDTYLKTEVPGHTHAVLLLDIDNFKHINDSFGHPFGDSVIFEISRALGMAFRTSDYIGRIGGDEFMAFVKNIDSDTAQSKAQGLCSLINQYSSDYSDLTITVSVGIAMFPDNASSFTTLYRKADIALYEAKRRGKNNIVLYEQRFEKDIDIE